MLVVNLVSWAGLDFMREPGQVIELPPEIAKARIAAGLCAPERTATEKSKAAPAARSAEKRRAPIDGE